MPREQINYPQTRPTVATFHESGTVKTETDAALHVSWNRDGQHVQLCLEVDVHYAQLAADEPNANEARTRTELWTPVLSRQDINKLIRTLRRARDTAYGADA